MFPRMPPTSAPPPPPPAPSAPASSTPKPKSNPPVYTSLYRTTPPPVALHLPTLAAVVAYAEYLERDWTPAQALKWFKVEGDWTEASHWRGEASVGGRGDGRLGRLIGRCVERASGLRGLDLSLPSIYLPPSLFQKLPPTLSHLSLSHLSWRFIGASLHPPAATHLTLLTSLTLTHLPSFSARSLSHLLSRNPALQHLRLVSVSLGECSPAEGEAFLSSCTVSLAELRSVEIKNTPPTSPHGLFHLIHPSRNLHTLLLTGSFPPARHPRLAPPADGADDATSMPFRAYFMHFLPLFPHLSRLEIDGKSWGKERDGLGLVEVLGLGADVGPPSDWQRWEVEEAWRPGASEGEGGIEEDREWVMAEGGKWVWVSDAEPLDEEEESEGEDEELDQDQDQEMLDESHDSSEPAATETLPLPASSALRRSTAKLFASLQESTTRSLEAAFAAPPAADGDLLRDGEAFCGIVLDRVEEEVRRMREFVRRGGVRAQQQQVQVPSQSQGSMEDVRRGVEGLTVGGQSDTTTNNVHVPQHLSALDGGPVAFDQDGRVREDEGVLEMHPEQQTNGHVVPVPDSLSPREPLPPASAQAYAHWTLDPAQPPVLLNGHSLPPPSGALPSPPSASPSAHSSSDGPARQIATFVPTLCGFVPHALGLTQSIPPHLVEAFETPPLSPRYLTRNVRSLLNRLTMDNWSVLAPRVVELLNASAELEPGAHTIRNTAREIWARAVDEGPRLAHADAYILLAARIRAEIWGAVEGSDEAADELFHQELIAGFHENDTLVICFRLRPMGPSRAPPELGWKGLAAPVRMRHGVFWLLDALHKVNLVPHPAILDALRSLADLPDPSPDDIEVLCGLFAQLGPRLDHPASEHPPARETFDAVVASMKLLAKRPEMGMRARLMLMDCVLARARAWALPLRSLAPFHLRTPAEISVREAQGSEVGGELVTTFTDEESMGDGESEEYEEEEDVADEEDEDEEMMDGEADAHDHAGCRHHHHLHHHQHHRHARAARTNGGSETPFAPPDGEDTRPIPTRVTAAISKLLGVLPHQQQSWVLEQIASFVSVLVPDPWPLREFVRLVIERACADLPNVDLYATLTSDLSAVLPRAIEDPAHLDAAGNPLAEGVLLRKYLLAEATLALDARWPLPANTSSRPSSAPKDDGLGLMCFFGYACRLQLLSARFCRLVIERILGPDRAPRRLADKDIGALVMLLGTAGSFLDTPQDAHAVDAYLERLKSEADEPRLGASTRLKVQDLIALRKNGWVLPPLDTSRAPKSAGR